jgi:CHAT domain-containing protein
MDAAYLALSSLTSGSALSNLVTAPQAEERRKAEDRYHIAQRKINILRAELYARHPSFRRLQGADAPSLSQFQALAARNPDTLYLEWVTDDASTLLFAVSHETGLQGFNLPKGRSELADGVDRWRATLEAQSERDPARRRAAADLAKREPDEAQALYRVLLGELEEAGLLEPQRFARLVIVPDGPLLTLPFAALCSPSGHRLIDRYALSVSISLGILCWPESDIKPTGSLLCIAASDGESQVSSRWGYFPPLAAVQQEIDAIRGLFPDACVLQGDEAVKPRIRQEIGRYAVLHFTTHGWLSPADPMSSGLLLPRAPAVSEEEGVLEAREILGQPLAARMAVLSACHSGQGHERGGEGLLGLVWAFHAAGCPAVVAAQWSANDGATAALMERLYTELRRGLRKDEAMRAAMRHLRDQAGPAYPLAWKLPYFWATFQVNGNTASLDVNGQAEVQSYPVPLRRQT